LKELSLTNQIYLAGGGAKLTAAVFGVQEKIKLLILKNRHISNSGN